MTHDVTAGAAVPAVDLEGLDRLQRRILWLAVRIIHHANHERSNLDQMKVGGHQASSASVVSIMTALYFAHIGKDDRVAVKPHASPVLHAIEYLLGNLERHQLLSLREFGGLQAYPSRTKDPFRVDFSTGSVGLGAAATLFGALTRRYVDAHFGTRPRSRFIALIGDAELDEGNIWEAITEEAAAGLGEVCWIIDLNRQSLDRIVPGIRAGHLEHMFSASGWNVIEVKYGPRLREAFERPGGDALRHHLDIMPNQAYQAMFSLKESELRDRFLLDADPEVKRALSGVADGELASLLHNLGGHDLGDLLGAFRVADSVPDQPSVIFAYTIKGWGLPFAGSRLNHAALLSPAQLDALREELGFAAGGDWDLPVANSPEGDIVAFARRRFGPTPQRPEPRSVPIPESVGARFGSGPVSTQEAFGRVLGELASREEIAERVVTVTPDVAISTNLGGWINKRGVFAPVDELDFGDGSGLLSWRPSPRGQHIELGISEMNLFLLLGQLGLAFDLSHEQLLPVGTVYDPFVCRGLDAFIYSLYSGARFVIAGTPSGITLSAEGGAHQSTITSSIGFELPGLEYAEPAYARALEWVFCDSLRRVSAPDGSASYLRLSTRPVDQGPFLAALERLGEETLRAQVVAGGYRLVDAGPATGRPLVHLAGAGAVLVEVVAAAAALEEEGVAANVIDLTVPGRLYHGWRSSLRAATRRARMPIEQHHLGLLLPESERSAPIVTVHDASSHALAWLGSVFGSPAVPVGVDGFGQSGSREELYRAHDLDTESIVNTALIALQASQG